MKSALLTGLPVLAILGWTFRQGYLRRRGMWTRRSWALFAAALLAAVAAFLVALAMASGVDHGVYRGMSRGTRRLYFGTLMALTIASPVVTVALLMWFANGRPERQFGRPWAGNHRRVA